MWSIFSKHPELVSFLPNINRQSESLGTGVPESSSSPDRVPGVLCMGSALASTCP